jgi:hypothetical protein
MIQMNRRPSEVEIKKIPVYKAQLKIIDEICREREKPRNQVFLEAVQLYIGLYRAGEV